MRNSLYSVSFEDAIQTIGGHHRYQKLLVALVSGIWAIQAFFIISLKFSLISPTLECSVNSDDCCKTIYKIAETSPYNAAREWDLVCDDKYKIDLINVCFYAGLGIGIFLLSWLANAWGRKPVIFTCLICAAVSLIAACLSVSAEFFMGCCMAIGFFIGGIYMTCLAYLIEAVSIKFRGLYTGAIFVAWGCGMLLMSLFSLLVDSWRIQFIVIAFFDISMTPIVFKFHESPRFLAANRGKYSKARYILNNIAHINSQQPFVEMLEGEKVIGYQEDHSISTSSQPSDSTQSSRKYSFIPISKGIVSVTEAELKNVKHYSYIDLCRLQSVRAEYAIIFMLFFLLGLSDLTDSQLAPSYLENNYINQSIISAIEILAYAGTVFSLGKMGRQVGLLITFGITGLSLLIALAFSQNKCSTNAFCAINTYVSKLLLSISRLGICGSKLIILIMINEKFPTSIRSLSLGGLGVAIIAASLLYPQTIIFFAKSKMSPMLGIGILMLFGSVISCMVTETKDKPMEDYVEEEKEEMKNPVDISNLEIQPAENNSLNHQNENFQQLNEEQ
ncbi:unnamed protein product [Blepharisma stoltei]|uniref:Uncharacterized protein n=1 Tax=Blepharisma stoltei TaxID=1481888 RepID=A0AAU9JR14_9CILI|nr:unnamed protein product [Blepharisma stoltei]